MLRIASICETYPPEYGGGAAIYVRDVCEALALRGHTVRVLASTVDSTHRDFEVLNSTTNAVSIDRLVLTSLKGHDPDGWSLGARAWQMHEARVYDHVTRWIGAAAPDVILYSTCRPFGEAGVLAAVASGVPVCAFLHDAWFVCLRVMLQRSPTGQLCAGPGALKCWACIHSQYDGLLAAAVRLPRRVARYGRYFTYRLHRRRRAWNGVTAGLAYSRFIADVHYKAFGRTPVRHVPLGVNRAGLGRPPQRPRDPLRFGFFAGNQPTKGLNDILLSADGLARMGARFELHVWGPGTDSSVILDRLTPALRERVRLRGMFDAREVWQAYDQVDVALMATTVAEPFGRIPIEAAAAGVPTIAPAVGGITESIIDGVSGFLFPRGSTAILQRAMASVVNDTELYKSLLANLPDVPNTATATVEVEAYLTGLARARGPRVP